MRVNFKTLFQKIKSKRKQPREHSKRYLAAVGHLNRYSLVYHALGACLLTFAIELISRRSLYSACTFVAWHTMAFFYNSFIVFASLTIVYIFRRRAFFRILISSFWLLLGIINGCILSNRVTPFGYTDLKCISDLLSMTNTSYFTAKQATAVVFGSVIFFAFCVLFFIKGPRFQGRIHKVTVPAAVLLLLFIGVPATTSAAKSTKIVASYFSNIAQGYENYGFVYGFSSSVIDRGMKKPENYSDTTIAEIMDRVEATSSETTVTADKQPNIILVLLESVVDPDEIKFLDYTTDPLPMYHYLKNNYSSGYLTVPVVGAGTANTEFEILSGMGMRYFGTGEYPYKTILKHTNCEGIAADLAAIGYGTHAVHNNGGNFYSRVNAFSMMGFHTFTSKELMDYNEYTPNGSWITDDILVGETIKTLDATPDQADFVYTITVGTHGDYPKEPVIENLIYESVGAPSEAEKNQWDYYLTQLNEIDTFMYDLIQAVDMRGEDSIIVFFGDHLPTMGLEDEDMVSGDIFKTQYVTWNNMGLEKNDADLYAYQLMAHITDTVGIHEGTMFKYHQTQSETEDYLTGMEQLQYDILYGSRYCYGETDKYPATDIIMGIDEVVISDMTVSEDESHVLITGESFTRSSRVYVNGEKISTTYLSPYCLQVKRSKLEDGDLVVVNQLGSKSTIFRSSNEFIYSEPEEIPSETLETIGIDDESQSLTPYTEGEFIEVTE